MSFSAGCLRGDSNTSETPAQPIPPKEWRQIYLAPYFYDWSDHSASRSTIALKNQTDCTIRFGAVATSCGCAQATLDAMEVGPGESTNLDVSLNLHGVVGVRNVSVEISAEPEPWHLWIHAPAYPRAKADSTNLQVGVVKPNSSTDRTVSVLLHAASRDELPTVQSLGLHEDLVVGMPQTRDTTLEGGVVQRRVTFPLTLKSGDATGPFRALLELAVAGGENISVPVHWFVRGAVEITPQRLVFRKTQLTDGKASDIVTIRRHDGRDFRITTEEQTHPALNCVVLTEGALTEHQLRVELDLSHGSEFTIADVRMTAIREVEELCRFPVLLVP